MAGNPELTKQLIDSFHLAKKIPGMLPELPNHLTPRHIHILDHVCQAEEPGIRISEIAKKMHSTMPSITKMVSELEEKGLVEKSRDPKDRRAYTVHAAPSGMEIYRIYVEEYYEHLAELLKEIPEEDIRTAVRVIQTAYDRMSRNPIQIENPNSSEN